MTIERRAWQCIAVSHSVLLPFLVQLFKRQVLVRPQRIDEPYILLENLCWFHVDRFSDFYKSVLVCFFATFIAFLEVAKAAGVVESADFLAEADDATDTFDGQHE